MDHAHSHDLSHEKNANLLVARELWEKLKGIEWLSIEDAMIHFLCVIHMAELLALSNREAAKKQTGVFDVLSCGVTDSATVMGVSSTLRRHLAADAVNRQLCQNVGAFDSTMSRLCADMKADASQPPKERPFDTCAEHVVYEKLGRLGYTANSTYAVQMVKPKSGQGAFSIKLVERCQNCKEAGGPSSPPSAGHPFGSTPRLGAIVTDSPALVDLPVPVLTPPVMQIIRDTLRGSEFNDRSRAIVTQRFPSLRVFRSPSWQAEFRVLPMLGSQEELDEMYLDHHIHDEL